MMQKYALKNLDCANCALKIETAVQNTAGVNFASVDFATATLFLDADNFTLVRDAVRQVEPEVELSATKPSAALGDDDTLPASRPIWIAGALFFAGLVFQAYLLQTPFQIGFYLIFGSAYLVSGYKILQSAFRNITRGQIFDEHFLMSVATIGAIAIGEMPEAVGVMLFYLVGEYVQGLSIQRARRSIRALLEVRPDSARKLVDGRHVEVAPETVLVGDLLWVKPGEKIPLDGVIQTGSTFVDAAPLTGESLPQKKEIGDSVLAGSVNQRGVITLKVSRPFQESSISKILNLVQTASSRKAATEKFITRFARVYSPIVFFIALGVALVPPLLGFSFADWLYRALVILVISCPCALVISIPLGYFGGVGGASRQGILVKGSNYLDVLAAVKTVVFDKTGTLTQGKFVVSDVAPRNGFSETDLLRFAVQAEAGSDHPIAQSIRTAFGELFPDEPVVPFFEEIAGFGVQALVDGVTLRAGNDAFLHRENILHEADLCDLAGTVVHVVVDETYAGYILVSDALKPDSEQAVRALRRAGVEKIIMLTGDSPHTAAYVAQSLSVDAFQAGLLPEDKVAALETILQARPNDGKIAFVGDGINDAPALARADVGIAMGALGTEAAIETADVVIMTDSPARVAQAIQVGRKTRQIVIQNIGLALVVKGLFIALGVAGEASMWQAVFGDIGVALLAVLNATRALK